MKYLYLMVPIKDNYLGVHKREESSGEQMRSHRLQEILFTVLS